MKKSLSILVASMMMCSVVFASPSANEPSFTGLSTMEHAALFGEDSQVQVSALDNEEMKATEGEWIWMMPYIYRVAYYGTGYLISRGQYLPATYDSMRNRFR